MDTFAPGVWVRLDGDDEVSLARRMGTTWDVLDRVLPAAKPTKAYLATRLGNHVTSTLFQAGRDEIYNGGTWFCVGEKSNELPADQLQVPPPAASSTTYTHTPTHPPNHPPTHLRTHSPTRPHARAPPSLLLNPQCCSDHATTPPGPVNRRAHSAAGQQPPTEVTWNLGC